MRTLVSFFLLVIVMVSTGCQQVPFEAGASPQGTPSLHSPRSAGTPTQSAETADKINRELTQTPERVAPTEAKLPLTGEVPAQLLNSILKDLAQRSGVSTEKITVLQAQEIVWNDGSLGCPQPGTMYTQALVDGFRVILQVGDKQYDYHASKNGYFFLCENSLPSTPLSGMPDS